MECGIVEISKNNIYISKHRGFLKVCENDKTLGEIPLDTINSVIISADTTTISKQLLTTFAENGIATVICGKNYHPISITLPYENNNEFSKRLKIQVDVSKPLQKRIWQKIIVRKLLNQALTLSQITNNMKATAKIMRFSEMVRSGDPENYEAQGAKVYWEHLFDKKFTRNKDGNDENIAFNYSYTVLRAAMARAITGVGLIPALGIHHRSYLNSFALVDDLMEPYRPICDFVVKKTLKNNDFDELTPKIKKELASILTLDLKKENGEKSPLVTCIHKTAYSLFESYQDKENKISYPCLNYEC